MKNKGPVQGDNRLREKLSSMSGLPVAEPVLDSIRTGKFSKLLVDTLSFHDRAVSLQVCIEDPLKNWCHSLGEPISAQYHPQSHCLN